MKSSIGGAIPFSGLIENPPGLQKAKSHENLAGISPRFYKTSSFVSLEFTTTTPKLR
jgi:hypothetical protein